mgnify:CR=1 FL=1
MDKIILKDGTEFEIADGASLGNIQIQAKKFDEVKTITDKFNAENISEVTFSHNGETAGEYENLKKEGFTYLQNVGDDGKEDGTYTVIVTLRKQTEMELAIEELKAGHESNAGAIQDLANMVAGGEV